MKIIFALFAVLLFAGIIQISYASTESCQCVAFRLDDIQDYWLDNVQTKIIDTFQQKNASLTIGIIGNHIGQDAKITDDIKSKLKLGNPEIEIANHGWNHEDFTQFNLDMQSILMKNTNDKISSLFGITPSVFIPPFNTINSNIMVAFLQNNFQYISANTTQDAPHYLIKNTVVYHLPGTAKTGNLNDGNTYWYSENHRQTFAEIMDSLQKYGYAIIVMHPQEYSVRQALNYSNTADENQIHELELLIDEVRNDGLKIVTISKIPKHITNQTIPVWTSNLFTWYEKGKISEDEVYNAVKFLMSQNVIQFNFQTITNDSMNADSIYPLHQNITTTFFWVGEPADQDNQFIDNLASIWDDKWLEHYGGIDDPTSRNGYFPAKFLPLENPFYFALPYNDYINGSRASDAYKVVYWANEKNWTDSESMLKNKWIKIIKGDKTAYAQWEDAGPNVYDDASYVFGNNLPKNKSANNSGLDVSPAVSDYIGLYTDNKNIVSWQFVNSEQVPDGPWKKIITTSQIYQQP
jgi:peptidoglycan/xylan/chitin deacetylase (PgdA/CDA1 family)